ncbi:MAG: helix-turn-helix domain-containing protein [Anaerolineales bacterium]|nr:helix-turn-helix domain-containing protein [Anaerolineales bacterium]
MQKTRQEILTYLKTHPAATAEEISRYLDLTPANIRYHLGKLVLSGRVQISGKRGQAGAGRPTKLYNLTSRFLGTNIESLLMVILDTLGSDNTANTALSAIAEILADKAGLNPGNRIQRYNQALEYLNQLNYHATWEAHTEGPQVMLRHCPYLDLAKEQDQLCQIDTHLLSLIFNTTLKLTQKREFGINPYSPCIFKP